MADVNQPMMVIRKRLTPDELHAPNLRANPVTGVVETSPDGGTTWIPAPDQDPRHADTARLPALDYPDAACDAAARIVHAWQDTLVTFENSVTAAIFATHIMGAFLLLTPLVGILANIGLLVFDQLTTIGLGNITAAFTEEVWDDIECIIACAIGVDGQVSVAQRDAIMEEISVTHAGVVYNTILEMTFLFGEVLMSNAGVEYGDAGDCDECGCAWCYAEDLLVTDGGLVPAYGSAWSSSVGWTQGCVSGFGALSLDIFFGEVVSIRNATLLLDVVMGNTFGENVPHVVQMKNGATVVHQTDGISSNGVTQISYDGGYLDVDSVHFEFVASRLGCSGNTRGIGMSYRGRGTNPFGVSNC